MTAPYWVMLSPRTPDNPPEPAVYDAVIEALRDGFGYVARDDEEPMVIAVHSKFRDPDDAVATIRDALRHSAPDHASAFNVHCHMD